MQRSDLVTQRMGNGAARVAERDANSRLHTSLSRPRYDCADVVRHGKDRLGVQRDVAAALAPLSEFIEVPFSVEPEGRTIFVASNGLLMRHCVFSESPGERAVRCGIPFVLVRDSCMQDVERGICRSFLPGAG